MPYKRKYTHKKTSYRRKPTMKRTVARNARSIRRIQSTIETKESTEQFDAISSSSTPSYFHMSGVGLGITAQSRIGQTIRATSLDIAISATMNPADVHQLMRFVVLVDTLPQGLIAQPFDVLQDPGAAPVTMPFQPRNWITRRRFHVLKDVRRSMTVGHAETFNLRIHLKIPKKYQLIQFRGAGNLIIDAFSNALLWFVANPAGVLLLMTSTSRKRLTSSAASAGFLWLIVTRM